MVAWILKKILGSKNQRELKRLMPTVRQINEFDEQLKSLSDDELRAKTANWKEEISKITDPQEQWAKLDEILPEAFAVVKNAARRLKDRGHSFTVCDQPMGWDMVHFDVQLLGGVVLHRGRIAEMATGEGKTLVATLPLYLNALTGRGAHLVTVNDYLARRDAEWMGQLYKFLGLTCGVIQHDQPPDVRREQYAMDITYGTNSEFGFDYLRDNGMATTREQLVHRGYHYAIVDEVDSILIDEARTPLIISGPASGDNNRWYVEFARLVSSMEAEVDYEVEEKKRAVGVLEPGIEKIEKALNIENLYDPANTPLIGFLNNAIKAKELFKKDRDYVVQGGEVDIVDEHTGRLLKGRRYSEGLHQAIEAKEGVAIRAENQTYASITLQNYFRLYDKLAGMTGTAQTEAAELNGTYGLGVIPIPTNMPMIRDDQADLLYKTTVAKYDAVIEDILE